MTCRASTLQCSSTTALAAAVGELAGGQDHKLAFESFFNHFDPFFYGMMLYLVAFIVACVALLG